MKKNLYYRTVFQRRNTIAEAVLGLFLALSSWPRMLLEVFIRRNFGERYFSFSGALTLFALLAFIPLFFIKVLDRFYSGSGFLGFVGTFLSWYLFLAGFLVMAIRRRDEVKHLPSVFDFARFSLSTGIIHPRFLSFELNGKPASIRTIETILEPGLFFIIGFSLWMVGQPIGFLLVICSICYALSYKAAYNQGDHFVMDKIDEMICNEELVRSFVEGRDPSETRGFNFIGPRPADPEVRRRVVETFMDDETVLAM